MPGSNLYQEVKNSKDILVLKGVSIVRVKNSLFFSNIDDLRNKFMSLIGQKAIILDMAQVANIDSTACQQLFELFEALKVQSMKVILACVKPKVQVTLQAAKIFSSIGQETSYSTIHAAVDGLKYVVQDIGDSWEPHHSNHSQILSEKSPLISSHNDK